jgi:hypothetical protein
VLALVVGPFLLTGSGCAGLPGGVFPGIPVAKTAAILNSTADSVRARDVDQDGYLRGLEILGLTADIAAKLLMEARRPEEGGSTERSAVSAREIKVPVDRAETILRASAASVVRWDISPTDGVLKDAEIALLVADLGTQFAAESDAPPR